MGIRAELKKSLKRKSKGQQIIEVALIFLPLVLLVGAAVDWGIGLFASHVAQNAAREGVRIAVTQTKLTVAESEARRVVSAVMLEENGKKRGLFSGFNVAFECIPETPPMMQVRVWGDYNFRFLRLLGFTTMTISRQARMYYERLSKCPL